MIVYCPECKAKYQIPEERKGMKFRCKSCSGVVYTDDLRKVDMIDPFGIENVAPPAPVKSSPAAPKPHSSSLGTLQDNSTESVMLDALDEDLFDFTAKPATEQVAADSLSVDSEVATETKSQSDYSGDDSTIMEPTPDLSAPEDVSAKEALEAVSQEELLGDTPAASEDEPQEDLIDFADDSAFADAAAAPVVADVEFEHSDDDEALFGSSQAEEQIADESVDSENSKEDALEEKLELAGSVKNLEAAPELPEEELDVAEDALLTENEDLDDVAEEADLTVDEVLAEDDSADIADEDEPLALEESLETEPELDDSLLEETTSSVESELLDVTEDVDEPLEVAEVSGEEETESDELDISEAPIALDEELSVEEADDVADIDDLDAMEEVTLEISEPVAEVEADDEEAGVEDVELAVSEEISSIDEPIEQDTDEPEFDSLLEEDQDFTEDLAVADELMVEDEPDIAQLDEPESVVGDLDDIADVDDVASLEEMTLEITEPADVEEIETDDDALAADDALAEDEPLEEMELTEDDDLFDEPEDLAEVDADVDLDVAEEESIDDIDSQSPITEDELIEEDLSLITEDQVADIDDEPEDLAEVDADVDLDVAEEESIDDIDSQSPITEDELIEEDLSPITEDEVADEPENLAEVDADVDLDVAEEESIDDIDSQSPITEDELIEEDFSPITEDEVAEVADEPEAALLDSEFVADIRIDDEVEQSGVIDVSDHSGLSVSMKVVHDETDLQILEETPEDAETAEVVDLHALFPIDQRPVVAVCTSCSARYRLPDHYSSRRGLRCALCREGVDVMAGGVAAALEEEPAVAGDEVDQDDDQFMLAGDPTDEASLVADASDEPDQEAGVEVSLEELVEGEEQESGDGSEVDSTLYEFEDVDINSSDDDDDDTGVFIPDEKAAAQPVGVVGGDTADSATGDSSASSNDSSEVDENELAADLDAVESDDDFDDIQIDDDTGLGLKDSVDKVEDVDDDDDLFDFNDMSPLSNSGTDSTILPFSSESQRKKLNEGDEEDESLVDW